MSLNLLSQSNCVGWGPILSTTFLYKEGSNGVYFSELIYRLKKRTNRKI